MSDFMNTVKAISLICVACMAGGLLGTPVGAVISFIVKKYMPPRRMPIKYSRTRLRESIEWVSENKAGFSDDAADAGIDLPADIEIILTHFSLQIKSDILSYPEWREDILSTLDSKEHCCGCYSEEHPTKSSLMKSSLMKSTVLKILSVTVLENLCKIYGEFNKQRKAK